MRRALALLIMASVTLAGCDALGGENSRTAASRQVTTVPTAEATTQATADTGARTGPSSAQQTQTAQPGQPPPRSTPVSGQLPLPPTATTAPTPVPNPQPTAVPARQATAVPAPARGGTAQAPSAPASQPGIPTVQPDSACMEYAGLYPQQFDPTNPPIRLTLNRVKQLYDFGQGTDTDWALYEKDTVAQNTGSYLKEGCVRPNTMVDVPGDRLFPGQYFKGGHISIRELPPVTRLQSVAPATSAPAAAPTASK